MARLRRNGGAAARHIARHARHARRIRASGQFFGMLLGNGGGRLWDRRSPKYLRCCSGRNRRARWRERARRRPRARWHARRRQPVPRRNRTMPRPDGPRRARKDMAVSASTTVTFSGRRPSTALATSCGMACCASRDSVPPRVFTMTAAFDYVFLLAEQRFARQHQMDAHRLDFVQGLQRALEFAFERALVVHFFAEVRCPPSSGVSNSSKPRRALRGNPCAAVSRRAASSLSEGPARFRHPEKFHKGYFLPPGGWPSTAHRRLEPGIERSRSCWSKSATKPHNVSPTATAPPASRAFCRRLKPAQKILNLLKP